MDIEQPTPEDSKPDGNKPPPSTEPITYRGPESLGRDLREGVEPVRDVGAKLARVARPDRT